MTVSLPTRILIMLAFVAVLLRVVVPMGYMPEIGSGKIFQMTICSLEGPKTVMVDEDMQPVHKEPVQKEKCDFSMTQHTPFKVDGAAAFSVVAFAETKEFFVLRDYAFQRALFAFDVQARGPPVVI